MADINITEIYGENTGLLDNINALNTISNGLFIDFLLVSLFIMILFLMKAYDFRSTFLSSSSILLFTSILLWSSEIVSFSRVAVCFSILCIALLYSFIAE